MMIFASSNSALQMVLFTSFLRVILADVKNRKKINSTVTAENLFEEKWITALAEQLITEERPYSVVVWTPKNSWIWPQRTYDIIIRTFSRLVPTLQIESMKFIEPQVVDPDRRTLLLPTIARPRGSVSIAIIQEYRNPSSTMKVVEVILSKSISKHAEDGSMRPKVLLIIFGYGYFKRNDLAECLYQAWKRENYLDLTIIYIFKHYQTLPGIMYYDMFENRNYGRKNATNLPIFPDKLKNMRRSKINVGWMDREAPPDGRKFSDYPKPITIYFCRMHNCTVVLKKYKPENFVPDLCRAKLYVTTFHNNPLIVNMKIHELEAAVPHLKKEASGGQFAYGNLVLFFSISSVYTAIMKLIFWIFQLRNHNWTFLDILYCTLGYGLTVTENLKQRIFYLVLIMMSFYFGNNLVDIATEFNLETVRMSIESLEALTQLNLPIYSDYCGRDMFDQNLQDRCVEFRSYSEMRDCTYKLSNFSDRVCIIPEIELRVLSAQIINRHKQNGLRICNFPVVSKLSATMFNKGSPYVEKFNDVYLYLINVGLIKYGSLQEEVFDSVNLEMDTADHDVVPHDESAFYWSLFHTTTIIYIGAVIVLAVEWIWAKGLIKVLIRRKRREIKRKRRKTQT